MQLYCSVHSALRKHNRNYSTVELQSKRKMAYFLKHTSLAVSQQATSCHCLWQSRLNGFFCHESVPSTVRNNEFICFHCSSKKLQTPKGKRGGLSWGQKKGDRKFLLTYLNKQTPERLSSPCLLRHTVVILLGP